MSSAGVKPPRVLRRSILAITRRLDGKVLAIVSLADDFVMRQLIEHDGEEFREHAQFRIDLAKLRSDLMLFLVLVQQVGEGTDPLVDQIAIDLRGIGTWSQ